MHIKNYTLNSTNNLILRIILEKTYEHTQGDLNAK